MLKKKKKISRIDKCCPKNEYGVIVYPGSKVAELMFFLSWYFNSDSLDKESVRESSVKSRPRRDFNPNILPAGVSLGRRGRSGPIQSPPHGFTCLIPKCAL